MERNTLYHYTSLEALFAIIQNIKYDEHNHSSYFTMRGTHADFLNDLTEGRLLSTAMKELGIQDVLLNALESLFGYPFILSLSELNDDLNMWRCYAKEGKGISIGLDKSMLKLLYDSEDTGKLSACNYVTINQLVHILKRKGIEDCIKRKKNDDIKLLAQLFYNMLTYKDYSFHAEKEWRIHVLNFESDYRFANNYIIPYKDFVIPVSAIKSITFGPRCDFERNRFSSYRMLKNIVSIEDLNNIKFVQSKIPLK